MKPASLSRIVVAIAVGLLGMISIANSPAWSQSLIGDGYSAGNTAYSTYYLNGPTGNVSRLTLQMFRQSCAGPHVTIRPTRMVSDAAVSSADPFISIRRIYRNHSNLGRSSDDSGAIY